MNAVIRMRTHRAIEGLARDTGWVTVTHTDDVVKETEKFFSKLWRKVATCMVGETKETAVVAGWVFIDDDNGNINEVYCVTDKDNLEPVESSFIPEKLFKAKCDGNCDSCDIGNDQLKDMECAGNA